MTKHFARPQFPPRPTKGALVAAAKEQVKANEEKVKEERIGELFGQALEIVKAIKTDDAATASATKPDATPPAETAAVAASPAPTPPARAPKGTNDGLYALGKRYAPKTDRNAETWGKLTKALTEGPKTMKELAELVKGHTDFLGYMTRGGHIVPAKPAEVSG